MDSNTSPLTYQPQQQPQRGAGFYLIWANIWPFLKGLADSFGGTVAVFTMDTRGTNNSNTYGSSSSSNTSGSTNSRDAHKEMLLRRGNSPSPLSKETSSSTESLARRRVMERREQLSMSRRAAANKDSSSASSSSNREQLNGGSSHETLVWQQTVKCSSLNGTVFIIAHVFFNYLILPIMQTCFHYALRDRSFSSDAYEYAEAALNGIFSTCFIVPLFLLSKICNTIWFQDVADSAFLSSRGRPVMVFTIPTIIADSLWAVAIETMFLLQGKALSFFPISTVGNVIYFTHLCLLNSLYCFEYKWFNQGITLASRIELIEKNWMYFVAFGAPLTFFTHLAESTVVSGCIFSVLFPFYIVSANQAQVVFNPMDSPLRLFKPTTQFMDFLVRTILRDSMTIKKKKEEQMKMQQRNFRGNANSQNASSRRSSSRIPKESQDTESL